MAVRFIDRMMFPVVLTVSALTAFLLSAAPVAYGARVSPAERARAAAVYDMPASAADTIPEEDTVYALDEVMVVATRTSQEIVPVQMLSGEKLRTLGTHSIADAIRYFSGVQIKDYGGIGGLKTINVRSLGSQHVGVFYDGVELGNAQNGIVDLEYPCTTARRARLSSRPRTMPRRRRSICRPRSPASRTVSATTGTSA